MMPLPEIAARLRSHVRLMPGTVIGAVRLVPRCVGYGRPVFLTLRGLAALALAQVALHSGAGPAPVAGTLAGIATWLVITVGGDLAPSPSSQS